MTRDEAMQRGQRLYGDRFRYRVERRISSPEKRAAARERYDGAQAALKALRDRIEAQFGAERRALTEQSDQAHSEMRAYRFQVFESEPGSFVTWLRGRGDTWEEAFAAIEVPKPPASAVGEVRIPVTA